MTITKTTRAMISNYAAELGCDAIRIKRDGSVHFLGQMPGSNVEGWYLAAHHFDALLQFINPIYRHLRGEG